MSKKTELRKNVGNLVSVFRVIIGAFILGAGIYAETWWALIGFVPLITGTVSWCPFYKMFGYYTFDPKLEIDV